MLSSKTPVGLAGTILSLTARRATGGTAHQRGAIGCPAPLNRSCIYLELGRFTGLDAISLCDNGSPQAASNCAGALKLGEAIRGKPCLYFAEFPMSRNQGSSP